MKNKKFRVWASSVTEYYIDVEAKDEDEAWAIAKETDGGDFTEYDPMGIGCGGDWEIDKVEELKIKKKINKRRK